MKNLLLFLKENKMGWKNIFFHNITFLSVAGRENFTGLPFNDVFKL